MLPDLTTLSKLQQSHRNALPLLHIGYFCKIRLTYLIYKSFTVVH